MEKERTVVTGSVSYFLHGKDEDGNSVQLGSAHFSMSSAISSAKSFPAFCDYWVSRQESNTLTTITETVVWRYDPSDD